MSRPMLKRPRDAFDSSPASSTPPQRLAKRFHVDSDAFSDASAFHLPSDSPSNPFGRIKAFVPRDLPQPTPVSDHLVLRFQLGQQAHCVYRVATVPANYTFWHLHRLAQLLFGWKDYRKEKSPHNRGLRIERRTEHIFTVQKRIVFYASAKHAGLFKNGKSVLHIAGNVEELRSQCNDDVPWEREELYTLGHLWHRPGSTTDMTRAVIYEYDVFSIRKEAVYISLYNDPDKVKASLHGMEDPRNAPAVVLGSGLPDDDDDDEDFALDLQQFNEPHAFENFILSQEDADEEQDDDCSSVDRLAEEQARVKRRMSAPLPSRLPLDEDKREDDEEDVPPKVQMLTSKPAEINVPKPEKQRTSATQGVRLPDPDESCEVCVSYPTGHELSPAKKSSGASRVHLPDPEESCEIGADHNVISQPQFAPRKRMPLLPRLPDPEESCEVGADRPKEHRKHTSLSPRLPDPEESCEIIARRPDAHVAHPAPRKRVPFQPRLPDPEETLEVDSDASDRAPRKRVPREQRAHDLQERREIGALYLKVPRYRASLVPRLPDPEESREIGDDRPAARPVRYSRHAPRASLCGVGRHTHITANTDEVDELEESEAEV